MGTLLILIGGLIGAGSAFKKSFMSCWIFLINLAFSLYFSFFLAPLVVPLLEIPGLDAGYRTAIAVGGVFLILDIILSKITEQIIQNPENDLNLPKFTVLFSLISGFLSGIMVVGILIYFFIQTPFADSLPQRKEFRSAASKTLMAVIHTVNAFSFQSLTPEAKKELQSIRLLPKPQKDKVPSKRTKSNDNQPKNQSADKNQPSDGAVKKDSAEKSNPS